MRMNLQQRIDLLSRLGEYILSNPHSWQEVKEKANRENSWFTPEFIDLASSTIASKYLKKDILQQWLGDHPDPPQPKNIGIVMAGNIPLVGFHDLLAVFASGHIAKVKPSSKDNVLARHLVDTMIDWNPEVGEWISFSEMLKGCDVYIATGSNNTAKHFEYYFRNCPHIIRRNRTSIAVLTGTETSKELDQLADDVYSYFGRGCRNITKIYVPANYDFIPLLNAFRKYDYLADYHKYKNNYDYNLAIHILNKKYFMSNESLLLIEDASPFSPIGQLNYEFYDDKETLIDSLLDNSDLQCIVGQDFVPFGQAQSPSIDDYADGVNTLDFLRNL